MLGNHEIALLGPITARMSAENAADLSDQEITRTLSPCVSGHRLVPIAQRLRDAGLLSYDRLLPLDRDRP